jgi:hypothetical protein
MIPANMLSSRTFSSDPQRNQGWIGGYPGWISGIKKAGEWMQIDLGEDRDVTGIVTQARANMAAHSVTGYTVSYAADADADTFADVPGTLHGPTVDFLQNEWAAEKDRKFNAFFPSVVSGR